MSLVSEDADDARENDDGEEAEGDVERKANQVDIHRCLLFESRLPFVLAVRALDPLRLPHSEVTDLPLLLLEGV